MSRLITGVIVTALLLPDESFAATTVGSYCDDAGAKTCSGKVRCLLKLQKLPADKMLIVEGVACAVALDKNAVPVVAQLSGTRRAVGDDLAESAGADQAAVGSGSRPLLADVAEQDCAA